MADQDAINPLANKFYLLRDQRLPSLKKGKLTPWDPWPVDGYWRREEPVFKAAQKLMRDHNHKCIDNYIDRIVVFPASSRQGSRSQGGSHGMWLYSIRSPSTLPVRAVLWLTPASKPMIRHGTESQSLESYISSWASAAATNGPDGFCKHYHFWKSIKVTEKWLETIPKHLHQRVHERWWMVNGFRFLELPSELREMILEFAMGPFAEPFAKEYRKGPNSLTTPNMSLALVNKQLHREVVPVLCTHTTFRLRSLKHSERFFFQRANPYKLNLMTSRRLIRYLELDTDLSSLLRFFGIEMRNADNRIYRYMYSYSPYGSALRWGLTEKLSIRRIRIRIPHVMEYFGTAALRSICQKVFCSAFWAGAREFLRRIPTVELVGRIDESKRKEWMEELSLERKGILPDPDDFHTWQHQMLKQWYVLMPMIVRTVTMHFKTNLDFSKVYTNYCIALGHPASAPFGAAP